MNAYPGVIVVTGTWDLLYVFFAVMESCPLPETSKETNPDAPLVYFRIKMVH